MSRTDRIRFPGALGDDLAARIEWPVGPVKAFALFAHCFTCGKDLNVVRWISRELASRGYAVLRFDFTGLGESEGDFADTNFSSNLEDLLAAVGWLREHHRAPKLLIGHSLGGAAVLAAARQVEEATAIVTIGAPSNTKHLGDMLRRSAPGLAEGDEAEVALAGRPFRIRRQLVDDLEKQEVLDDLAKTRRALLVLHSPVDEIVGIEHARRIYEAAQHPKSFVSLDDADHLLLKDPRDAKYAAQVIATWASRYVESEIDDEQDPPKGTVVVSGGARGYAQDIAVGEHRLRADEPESVGGDDTGPTPYGYLLTALGTCTSMTMKMYADRKKWPLDGVRVELEHQKVAAEDCDDCETETGQVDVITRRIDIEGTNLDDDQRARLLEIADRCPVHRTLTSETVIRTEDVSPVPGVDDEG